MTHSRRAWFCPLLSHRLSQMGGGTHRSLVNTCGLNAVWAQTQVQSGDVAAHPQLGSDTALGGLLSARESVSEGGDSWFLSRRN